MPLGGMPGQDSVSWDVFAERLERLDGGGNCITW